MFENFLDSIFDFLQKVVFTKKVYVIILVLSFVFVAILGVFFILLEINFNNVYFTFRNTANYPINLVLEDYYGRELEPYTIIQPFSEKKIKILYEGLYFKVFGGPGKDASIGYYISSGESFFFKTRYLLEYDGDSINEIYGPKVDDWFW